MNKNRMRTVDMTWRINRVGNWNRMNKEITPIYTKPITEVCIEGDTFVWKHEEILELIKAYHQSDIEAIEMIKRGEAGEVRGWETPLLDKIKKFIQELEEKEKQK